MAAPATPVSNLRILVLAPTSSRQTPSAFPPFLTKLTRNEPSEDLTSFAGYTSHTPLHLETKYYTANVSLWCDELPALNNSSADQSSSQPIVTQTGSTTLTSLQSEVKLSEWQDQMTSSTAREVRDVIGAIVLLLNVDANISNTRGNESIISNWASYIETVTNLRDQIEDETGREVASLVILTDFTTNIQTHTVEDRTKQNNQAESVTKLLEKLEDECLSTHGILGWDYVIIQGNHHEESKEIGSNDQSSPLRNEYGERTGLARVIEVLEQVDWTATAAIDLDKDSPVNPSDIDMSFLDDLEIPGSAVDQLHSTRGNIQLTTQDTTDPTVMRYHPLSQDARLDASTEINQYSNDFEREIMELKMAMLDVDDNRLDSDNDNDDNRHFDNRYDNNNNNNNNNNDDDDPPIKDNDPDDDFSALVSAELPKDTNQGDDDVWAALDEDTTDHTTKVDSLQGLMERVIAIREAGSEMSAADRETFAKREIARLMKEL